MATPFQDLIKLQRQLEEIQTCITLSRQERYIMDKYNQEESSWYDFEVDCDDWYMDSCQLWDENHFHILFDDSNPPSLEKSMWK